MGAEGQARGTWPLITECPGPLGGAELGRSPALASGRRTHSSFINTLISDLWL